MGIEIRGEPDNALTQVRDVLTAYLRQHPDADIAVRRSRPHTIRVRVIDPAFAGIDYFDRHDLVWPFLEPLPDDMIGQVTGLILLAPAEVAASWGNRLFEGQVPAEV